MYEVYGNYSDVNDYMNSFDTTGLFLVVGDFGMAYKGQAVAYKKIMEFEKYNFLTGLFLYNQKLNYFCALEPTVSVSPTLTVVNYIKTEVIEGSKSENYDIERGEYVRKAKVHDDQRKTRLQGLKDQFASWCECYLKHRQ